MSKGLKYDNGKAPIVKGALQYFPEALMYIARVSEFGATKYAWDDWRHVPEAEERYLNALGRHLVYDGQEVLDPDSGLAHLAHAAWNALAVLELRIKRNKEEAEICKDTLNTSTSLGMRDTFQQQNAEKLGAKQYYDTLTSSKGEELLQRMKEES